MWLLYGDSQVFADALESDGHVAVRLKDGTHATVEIERYTTPNFEGYGYAWPVGTRKDTTKITVLPPTPERHDRQVIGKHYRQRGLRKLSRRRP